MFKFFRKIRKDLANAGKTSKYLKYALGEIILVVLGILIALQINTWNEGMKKKRADKTYLSNLLSEIETNQKELEEKMVFHDFVQRKTRELANLIHPDVASFDRAKLDTLMFAMILHPKFQAITSNLSSDKLELVGDYKLFEKVARWKFVYEEYNYDLQLSYDHNMNYVTDFVHGNYQIKNLKSPFPLPEQVSSAFPVDHLSIMRNPKFENQAVLRSLNADAIWQEAKEIFEIQADLIDYIRGKIDLNK